MTFGSPAYLYGLILVPLSLLFLVWAERRRRSAIARMGEPQLIARLSIDVNTRGRRIKAGLWLGALALTILSLARPQWGETRQTATQKGVQVMVVLDTSKSMLVQDVKPDRLTRAKMNISELMNRLNAFSDRFNLFDQKLQKKSIFFVFYFVFFNISCSFHSYLSMG